MLNLAVGMILWFTSPAFNPDSTGCGEIAWLLEDLAGVELRVASQSRTWQDSSAAMLADPAIWRRLWPRVAGEAAPQTLRSKPEAPGVRDSIEMPAGPWLMYGLVAVDRSGNASCPRGSELAPGPNPAPALAIAAAAPTFAIRAGPMPAGDFATIRVEPDTLRATIEVFDVAGRRMFTRARVRGSLELEVRMWPSGLYLVRAIASGIARGTRLVVIH